MKLKLAIIILIVWFLNLQTVSAIENEYGIVKASFNGENATVEGIKLKIGEPADIKVTITSKINGHVIIALTETGVTKAFDVLSGPSKQDESIDNLNIDKGWSKVYTWKVAPNGAWTNGNAPINVFVKFYSIEHKDERIIHFSIANPIIVNERYTGAAPAQTQTAAPPGTAPGAAVAAQAKPAPFPSALIAIAVLLAVWRWRHCS